MIDWLLQTHDQCPAEIRGGRVPHGMLSLWEERHFASLRTLKRRSEWLLGRWTAKQLIKASVPGAARWPLTEISIERGADGAPAVVAPHLPPLTLSISHTHGLAASAVQRGPDRPLGIDLEWIAPRSAAFVADYFTSEEQDSLLQWPAALRDTAVNVIWSAKEAALKALHLGLKVDTRRVCCPVPRIVVTDINGSWLSFEVRCDWRRLPCEPVELVGWLRLRENFVLTMVVPRD